jgi:hypothetical protein
VSACPALQQDPFAPARAEFGALEAFLGSPEACGLTHSELERALEQRGRELLRQLLQAHLEVRGPGEAVGPVTGADGVARDQARLHDRGLETTFGEVQVARVGYGAEGVASLHPLDADLNLPPELYSLEVRRRVAEEAAKSSFDEVVQALASTTGAEVGKRQVEELVRRAAQDFDAFYQERAEYRPAEETGPILVLTADGKGVVMRREDLREATRRRAARTPHKLAHRLSRGEKRHAKRMATVAAVYTIAPYVRSPEGVLGTLAPQHGREPPDRPRPERKRVWASLAQEPDAVLREAFREARRRDPEGQKRWVALVDGNETQLEVLHGLFRREGYHAWIVLDFLHVAERVWKAGRDFHPADSPELEGWVTARLLGILQGRASHVAAGMRRSATRQGLAEEARAGVDGCANYLLKYAPYVRYDRALAEGLPIATGVIEGACRHLVKDRMDRTGARWSLHGAEAVLRLRALRSSGDFEAYWRFHEQQEYRRHHAAQYADGQVVPVRGRQRRHLTRVK